MADIGEELGKKDRIGIFDKRAHEKDQSGKVGVLIPLHMEEDREHLNSLRRVCLLTMESRKDTCGDDREAFGMVGGTPELPG